MQMMVVPGVESAAAARVQASYLSRQSSWSTASLLAYTLHLFGCVFWTWYYGECRSACRRESAAFARRGGEAASVWLFRAQFTGE